MAIPATGQVGPAGSSGSGSPVRESREFAQVISQACGKYYESTSRGMVFCATSTTGRTPGTAISTSPPILLFNPVGSGKRYEILKFCAANAATGTLGTGGIFHTGFTLTGNLASQIGVLPTGSAATVSCLDIGSTATTSALALVAATVSVAPVALYPAFASGEAVGGTTALNVSLAVEDVDGAIVLEPGSGWAAYAVAAAGSSPLILFGVTWREAPYSP